MRNAELVIIPSPGAGHLLPTVELAKLLVKAHERLFITVFIMKLPSGSKKFSYDDSKAAFDRIKFVDLPDTALDSQQNFSKLLSAIVEIQKPNIREAVTDIIQRSESDSGDSPKLVGFVIDMFCTSMIDLANEFGVPTYLFFTSGTLFLSLMFHLQEHNFDTSELKNSDTELEIPGLVNPVPVSVLPQVLFNKESAADLFEFARRFRETKGILVNTFLELESHALASLSDGKNPILYHVGPVLNLSGDGHDTGSSSGALEKNSEIMKWLDDQPPSSVVFLCFGSFGTFREPQVKEIARALERSGHRFLWALRQPLPKGTLKITGEYENPEDVLPQGFMHRTAEIGKIIGWAPQTAVLAHPAIGGFVSHCGWNSTLESIWFGVPVATWPMYAEQQMNAFFLVKEKEMAVEIKMDYWKDMKGDNDIIVSAEIIERGIRLVMEEESEVRKKVKEMSEKGRNALAIGGSSYISLRQFIGDIMDNM